MIYDDSDQSHGTSHSIWTMIFIYQDRGKVRREVDTTHIVVDIYLVKVDGIRVEYGTYSLLSHNN